VYKVRQDEVLRADRNYDNLNLISNIRVCGRAKSCSCLIQCDVRLCAEKAERMCLDTKYFLSTFLSMFFVRGLNDIHIFLIQFEG